MNERRSQSVFYRQCQATLKSKSDDSENEKWIHSKNIKMNSILNLRRCLKNDYDHDDDDVYS